MQARYYDPVIGRFLGEDPVTFMDTGNPSQFNRYAYTFNDPVNLTDPDGENPARPIAGKAVKKHVHKPLKKKIVKALGGGEKVSTAVDIAFTDFSNPAGIVQDLALDKVAGPVKTLVSRIKESKKAVKAAEKAGGNQKVQADIDGLTAKLADGNMNPGIGTRSVGDGISEARGSNGGRVMFRETGTNTVEILGKSGKNSKNQQDAISAAKDIIKNDP